MLIKIGATVRVAHYFERSSHEVPVLDTFELFITAARFKFGLSGDARLFWFATSELKHERRVALTSQVEYLQFLSALGEGKASLYIHPNSAANSPHTDPFVVPSSTPARQPAEDDGASDTSARSSAMQKEMVFYVRLRDEQAGLPHECVACGASPSVLEVAHVVSRKTAPREAMRVGLGGLFTSQNGVQLCKDCHWCYDQHLWWVEPQADGRELIVVAEALLADELPLADSQKHFTALHGKPLQLPSLSTRGPVWPTPPMWALQRELCAKAREARHAAHDDSIGRCERCNKPYKSIRALRAHEGDCAASRRQRQRYIVTPADTTALTLLRRIFVAVLAPTAEVDEGAEHDCDVEDSDDAARRLFSSLEAAAADTPGH